MGKAEIPSDYTPEERSANPRSLTGTFIGFSFSRGRFLGVHHAEGRHVDDVLHLQAALEHVDRLGHPQQDRADRLRPGQPPDQLVGDVGRLQLGEDQDVRRLLQPAPGVALLQDLLEDRRVRLHLAVDLQVRVEPGDDLDGPAHLARRRVLVRAEVREREHGHPRHHAEAAGELDGEQRRSRPAPRASGSMLTVVSARKNRRSWRISM